MVTLQQPATERQPPTEAPQRPWRNVLAMAVAVVVGLALLGGAATVLARSLAPDPTLGVTPGLPVEVTISPGAAARTIASDLETAGVVLARELVAEIDARGVADRLQAGRYALETGMPAPAVVDALVAGPNLTSGNTVAVREGASITTIVRELAEQTGLAEQSFRRALLDGTVTSPYLPTSLPDGADPLSAWEGLLFPARYEVPSGADAAGILTILVDEMVTRVEGTDWSELDDLGVSRYEAMIVASLIEREALLDEERPLIASVIYNRLAVPMRLQIDATVIYARGETPGHVSAGDLAIESPYNTYRVDGLPPTPIGTVRAASLEAAAHPATSDFLFYVLVAPDGSHGFSITYEEHQEKVERAKAEGVFP